MKMVGRTTIVIFLCAVSWIMCNRITLAVSTDKTGVNVTAIGNLKEPERSRLVIIEFRVSRDGSRKVSYAAIRKAILDQLNKRNTIRASRAEISTSTQTIIETTEITTIAETTAVAETTDVTATTITIGGPIISRRRRDITNSTEVDDSDYIFGEDDITFVVIDPEEKEGLLSVVVFGTKRDGSPIDWGKLLNATNDANETGDLRQAASDLQVHDIRKYLPLDAQPITTPIPLDWQYILLIVLVVLLLISILVVICCHLYRRQSPRKQQTEPLVIRGEDYPTVKQSPRKDIDDRCGFIIPYDEYYRLERTQC